MPVSKRLKLAYHHLAARLVAAVLRPGATYSPGNFTLWQKHGYHILPVHFYSPVPDTRVLEIGSGHSSRIIAAALSQNNQGGLVSVDPYPSHQLLFDLHGFAHTIIEQKVEQLPFDLFDRLNSGDVLCIDSTHTVRSGGDVNFLFLEVLPRLRPGVIVHLHDIFLPEEYPRAWLLDMHIFWAEQYLLHAFLLFNSSFEILMANNFLGKMYPDLLKECFPGAMCWGGGSFWMQRKRLDTEDTS